MPIHVWPINGVLVTLLRDNIHKRQVIHNHMTQKSITMEILHACYVTCDKLQCHTLVVFLSVLWRFASMLWMFSIIIKIHNIQPIHNGSMAFTLFITLNNSLSTNMILKLCFASRLKCSNNLHNFKMNYEDNHRVNTQYSKPFTVSPCVSKLIIN